MGNQHSDKQGGSSGSLSSASQRFRAVQQDPNSNMKVLWNSYDTNQDGVLDKNEVRRFLKDLQEFLQNDEKEWGKKVMAKYDLEKDGQLTWEEFSASVIDLIVNQAITVLFELVSQEKCSIKDLRKVLQNINKEKYKTMADDQGRTPLYMAARAGNPQVVVELLNFEQIPIDDQQTTKDKSTPTHAAAWFKHAEVLALLLASGASSSQRNSHNLTPRDEAQGPCREVFKELEENGIRGLKKKWPIIGRLRNVAERPPQARNKKTFVAPTLHFEGLLDISIVSTSKLQSQSSDLMLIVDVDGLQFKSEPQPYKKDLVWNYDFKTNLLVYKNVPIQIFVVDAKTEKPFATLSLPVSLLASKEAQEAQERLGPQKRTYGLTMYDTKLVDASIETIISFTPMTLTEGEQFKSKQIIKMFANSAGPHITIIKPTGDQIAEAVAQKIDDLPLVDVTEKLTPHAQRATKTLARQFRIFQVSEPDFRAQVKFQESDLLSHGTFGYVYKGHLTETKSDPIAVKIIHDIRDKEALRHEVEIQSLFNPTDHPHLLPILMAFQTPKFFSILMPLCTCPLSSKFSVDSPLSEEISLNYGHQILKGIQSMFSLGYCHRDLKPDNIMFVGRDQIKLIDFGSSMKCVPDVTKLFGQTGSTPWYSPPDLFGASGYTSSVDLFAAGTIIFEMIFGDVPWWYDMATDDDIGAEAAHETWANEHPIAWGRLLTEQDLRPSTHELLKGLVEPDPSKRIDLATALKLVQ